MFNYVDNRDRDLNINILRAFVLAIIHKGDVATILSHFETQVSICVTIFTLRMIMLLYCE